MPFERASFSKARPQRPLVVAWEVSPSKLKPLFDKLQAGVRSRPETFRYCSSKRSMKAEPQTDWQLLICASDNEGVRDPAEWLVLTSGAGCDVEGYYAYGLQPVDKENGLWAYVDNLRSYFELDQVTFEARRGSGEHSWKALLREVSDYLTTPWQQRKKKGQPIDLQFSLEIVPLETCLIRLEHKDEKTTQRSIRSSVAHS